MVEKEKVAISDYPVSKLRLKIIFFMALLFCFVFLQDMALFIYIDSNQGQFVCFIQHSQLISQAQLNV